MVMIWLTLMIESLPNLDSFALILIFPGASPIRRLDVTTAANTVLIRLVLNSFEETITMGLRKPGSEPLGSAKEAHQISPFSTTSLPYPENSLEGHSNRHQARYFCRDKPD